jgi:hypothetical protein
MSALVRWLVGVMLGADAGPIYLDHQLMDLKY